MTMDTLDGKLSSELLNITAAGNGGTPKQSASSGSRKSTPKNSSESIGGGMNIETGKDKHSTGPKAKSRKSDTKATGPKPPKSGKVPAGQPKKASAKLTDFIKVSKPAKSGISSPEKSAPLGGDEGQETPTKYPQVDLARNRILRGSVDESLVRDIVRGGGVLVKGERIEFWYNASSKFSDLGIEELQQTLSVVQESSSGASTPVLVESDKPRGKSAGPKSTSGQKKGKPGNPQIPATDLISRWIRGTIVSTNKSKYTATVELDVPFRSHKSNNPGQLLKVLVLTLKVARWKLVEFVTAKYTGRVNQPRVDHKPSAPCEMVTDGVVSCELVWTSMECEEIDLLETRKEFLRARRSDPEMKRTYSFKYSVPENERIEMEELKKNEREGMSNLNRELRMKTDEIGKRVESLLSDLDKECTLEIEPIQARLDSARKGIDLERDEKTAGLESMEGRTSGTGSSIRVQKKIIDDHHKSRWLKEVVPLEKELETIETKWNKKRREIEVSGRDEIASLTAKRDEYLAAIKDRQQVLRDKWKKLAEDDVNAMKNSQNIRFEKEWIYIRRELGRTIPESKHPAGLVKGLDVVCNTCKLEPGYACQSGKCDSCFKFSIYESKIEELELVVPWANNRTSSDFTPYHVFYHERARDIRIEKPNTEPALISQICKDEWKKLDEKSKMEFERKRQSILLELVDNLEEDDEHREGTCGDLERLHESVLDADSIDSMDESDEACTKCLSLRNPQLILQCDRTEGEPLNAEDDRICGGMLHTYCCTPQLESVPPGDWYCSWMCKWIQDHKPVNSKVKKSAGRPKNFARLAATAPKSITDSVVIDDEVSGDMLAGGVGVSASSSGSGGGLQVKADVAIARRNRLEFILSQWEKIEYFMVDPLKIRMSLEAKFWTLDNQLCTIGTDGIRLRDKIESAGVAFPIDTTPSYVEADMREYQMAGLSWFIEQHDKGANSIMGDEMGLGKTLQTLSFLATLHYYVPYFSPFLVVCPLSVLPNWIAEAKRWTPQLNVVGLFGPQQERERIKETVLGSKQKDSVQLIVTTYEILLTEISWLRSQFYFRYFILDEAQKIKNTDALVTQACRQIRSVYRVLLTGTPLQNNMKELWSLLNFLYPEVFVSSSVSKFASAYDSSTTTNDTSENMIKNDAFMKECHRLLEPIMLRRLKQNVLAAYLPPKTEIVLTAPLSLAQKYHYKQVLKTVTGMVRNVGYKNVSSLLWQLWKCCLHPYLFEGVEEEASAGGHSVDSKIIWLSGKMCLLDSLLEKLFADKSKALVYSQYTSMLDIIEEYCQWRGWRYLRLDGSTSLARRRFYMHMFNRPVSSDISSEEFGRDHYFVFLVSTKAGGVGVNLQSANSVILYDSSWNPFVDAQAEDRAHRMGQKKEVTVYRLLTKDTCEERIRFFAEQKLKMKEFVLGEDASGEKKILEADPATADVSAIYSADQLRDILEFGSEELMQDSTSGGEFNPIMGEQFYNACCESLNEQLRVANELKKGGSSIAGSATAHGSRKLLSPVKRNICIRKYEDEDYSATRVERTTEMDWLDIMEEEKIMQRNRKATTVTVEEKGVGKIQISKWSIEEAEKERLQMEREKARIEAKKIGGNKRVTEHDMSCLHCHESVLKQRVIVTREIDDEGNEVKRRKIDSDTSGYQACPICPATLHYNCLRLAVHGSEFTVRSNCPQHKCRVCRRSASNAGGLLFRCTECPMALCYDCIEKYELVEKFKFIERENVKWEKSMGYTAASTYEYMHCPECMHQSLAKRAIHQVKGEVSSESKDIVMSDQ